MASAYDDRAATYSSIGQYAKALADSNRAIELDPKMGLAHESRADAYLHLGQYENALADSAKAIELAPSDFLAYVVRSDTYMALGQYDKAVADATKAIELRPDLALAYDARAEAYSSLGQFEKAIADATKAIELDPKVAVTYAIRARSYNHLGQPDKALADATRAIELDPKLVVAYETRSIVSWKEFKATFPQGKVLSRDTGIRRPCGSNPYTFYDSSGSPFLYDGPKDQRLSALEPVVAIDMGTESLTAPYSVLEKEPVVHHTLGGQELVVFFKKGTASALDSDAIAEGRDAGSVGVFDPHVDGRKLTFRVADDEIVDDQTGSTWNLLGKAPSRPLVGKGLLPLVHRAAQFWFSWVVSRPDTILYKGNQN